MSNHMYDIVGFDLDGTLYDEFEFIVQAYRIISEQVLCDCELNRNQLFEDMINSWLLYGSSKTDLFQEAFAKQNIIASEEIIKNCIKIYREAPFELHLSSRVECILNTISRSNTEMFILTDGNSNLQRRKINSLGLCRWFKEELVFISGDYGKDYQKPSVRILPPISSKIIFSDKRIAYFGDRNVDAEFAKQAGFDFYYAPCMCVKKKEV